MKTLVTIALIFTMTLGCSNRADKEICYAKTAEDYSPELVSALTSVQNENRILIDSSSVFKALNNVQPVIELDSTFAPVFKYKAELQCKIGNIDGAIKNAIHAYSLDKCDIYILPYMTFLFEKKGDDENADKYLNKAIDAFKSRCKIGCKPVDRSNLLFLELYSGQISNEEYIKSISVLNDGEFSYLGDIYSNFDKTEFVNNLCSF
jgi:tetratricopeptide (TPR) repeat protein